MGNSKKATRKNGSGVRAFYKISRWLHIYVSSALFSLLVLFCITGVVLNHQDWLEGSSVDGEVTLPLPGTLTELSDDVVFAKPPLAELQKTLATLNLKKIERVDVDDDAGEIVLDYQLPAGYATAIWMVGEPELIVEYRKGGAWQLLGDLHKGRHTGAVWSWVIDISAVVMVLFSVTGLILIWQNRRYRRLGGTLLLAGTFTPWLIYWLWVPRLVGS